MNKSGNKKKHVERTTSAIATIIPVSTATLLLILAKRGPSSEVCGIYKSTILVLEFLPFKSGYMSLTR